MGEFKGTKGKWSAFRQDQDIHIESETTADAIATLVGWNNDETGTANAKLISAAPELLEMLERCKRIMLIHLEGVDGFLQEIEILIRKTT